MNHIFVLVFLVSIQAQAAQINKNLCGRLLQQVHILIEEGNPKYLDEFLQKLWDYKISMYIINYSYANMGLGWLHYGLIHHSSMETLEVLLKHDTNPDHPINRDLVGLRNKVIRKGSAMAHVAIMTRQPRKVLELLAQNGIDFGGKYKNDDNQIPLDIAIKILNQEAVVFIADWHIAMHKKHLELLERQEKYAQEKQAHEIKTTAIITIENDEIPHPTLIPGLGLLGKMFLRMCGKKSEDL
jgi:hypothetical protein